MENSNKLIAEFMGVENSNGLVFQDTNTQEFHPIKYHTSWDWLMPVVAKIRSMPSYDRDKFGTEVILNGGKVTIKSGAYGDKEHGKKYFNKTYNGILYGLGHDPLKVAHFAILEYVKWYNENK